MAVRKLKSEAIPTMFMPDGPAAANRLIESIGEAQRERTILEAQMNDELARVKSKYEERASGLGRQLGAMMRGLQAWCEANRAELTRDGKTKTVKFAAGEVSWRMRPPSVTIRGAKKVLAYLLEKGMTTFVRTKHEIDKEAMLAHPGLAAEIRGVKIGSAG